MIYFIIINILCFISYAPPIQSQKAVCTIAAFTSKSYLKAAVVIQNVPALWDDRQR